MRWIAARLGLLSSVLWGHVPSLDVEEALAALPSSTVEIRLKDKGLTGEIPPDVPSRFPNLTVLDFAKNELSGTIPAGLELAIGLVELQLEHNQLHGPIPPGLLELPSLRKIDLASNLLSGSIPRKAGSWWPKVEEIHFTKNRLVGEIPAELGNLHSLRELRLDSNELTGSIPRELGALGKLEELDLKENKLSGGIPVELGNLSKLELLALADNRLDGRIPAEIGKLRSAKIVFLQGNKLSGGIPAELGNLTQVRYLYLQGNELTGNIPAELGSLSKMYDLRLSSNRLSGALPAAVGGWTNIMWLYLDNNHFSGGLPEEVGSWGRIHKLYLQSNRLTGRLPGSISNWGDLGSLHLGSNAFSGHIPDEVQGWTKVRSVNVSGNLFDGPVPKGIGNWTHAKQVNFDFNQLTSLPGEMNFMEDLEVFTMQGNRLQGTLLDLGGLGELSVLNLRGNAIEAVGVLPRLLKVLDLSSNKLQELPEPLDALEELESLMLTDNLISKWPARGVYAEVAVYWVEVSAGYGRPFPWSKLRWLEVSGNPLAKLSGRRREDKMSVVTAFLSSLAYLENLRFVACRQCNLTGALTTQMLPGLVDTRGCPGWAKLCVAGSPRPGMTSLQTLDLAENEISEITALPSQSMMKVDLSRNALQKLDQSWYNLQGQNSLMELKVRDNPQLRASVHGPKGPCSGEEAELRADPIAYVSQGEGYECTKLCRSRWVTYSIDSDLDESSLCRCKAGYGGSGRNCTPCQQDTYSMREDAFGLIRTCQGCPARSDTGGLTRAASISECKCPAGVLLNASANACVACPQWPFRSTRSRGQYQVSACSCSAAYTGLKEFNGICGCDDGYYLNHLRRACEKCSNSEICSWGVDLGRSVQPPKVRAGFWGAPIEDLATFAGNSIWRCASAGTCHEGGVCAEGRWGTACGLCQPGTTGGPHGPCKPCDAELSMEERRGMLVLGTVLSVIPAVILVHVGLTGVHSDTKSVRFMLKLRALRGSSTQMVKHFQSVSVIGGMSVTWPPIAYAFFDIKRYFSFNAPFRLASVGCLEEEPSAVFEMAVKWAKPLVFMLLSLLAMPTSWLLARVLRSLPCSPRGARICASIADSVTMVQADVGRVLLFSLTLFWSTLVANSFEILTCIPSPNGKLTVAHYPHIECDFGVPEFAMLFAFSVLTIMLYLLLPLRALYHAYQTSAESMASSLSSKRGWYSFLFENFRDGRLVWLLIIMVKDSLFVLIPACLPGQGSFQLLLVAVMTASYAVWVTQNAPFHNRSNNLLEAWNAGSAAVLCLYSAGMGYQKSAGMADVEMLFSEGAEDPQYRARAVGMVVVQVVSVAFPSTVLLYQVLCAMQRTRRLLPRRAQPVSREDGELWLEDFLRITEMSEGGQLAKIFRAFDNADLLTFRSLMEGTSATMGHAVGERSASVLVKMAHEIHFKKRKSEEKGEEEVAEVEEGCKAPESKDGARARQVVGI